MSNHRSRAMFVLLALLLLIAHDARADDRARRWYGWQTLAIYSVDIGALMALTQTRASHHLSGQASKAIAALTIAGLAFGGAIVHAGHGRWQEVNKSVGLDAGLPLAAGLVGAAACGGRWQGTVCGSLLAGLAWSVGATVDLATLSSEAAPAAAASARPPRPRTPSHPLSFGGAF